MNRIMALKLSATALTVLTLVIAVNAQQQKTAPLKLVHTIPLPQLHDGDFDHFYPDVEGNRLFSTAEENSKVLVFDLKTNKLTHTIEDLKAPHSMYYRADLKKLYIVDGDLGEIRIYDSESYKPIGKITLREGADASTPDPSTKYLYVVNGGKDAKLPNAYISVVDTSAEKIIGEIKIDSDDVEGITLDKSGPRMFVVVRGNNAVEVFDRTNRNLLATWSFASVAKKATSIAFDEPNHRLLVGAREPGTLILLNSDTGAIVTHYPAASMVDDMAFDTQRKRVYFAGSEFLDVFQQKSADDYERIARIPTSFRAKTGVYIPELNKFYLGVPHHEKQSAEVRVYDVQ